METIVSAAPDRIFICNRCGKTKQPEPDSIGTGYASDKEGNKFCYACMGELDSIELETLPIGGRTMLYYSKGEVINWPGTLSIKPHHTRDSRHNWGLKRTDIWFRIGKHQYHGKIIGSNTEILHVRKIKP